MKLILPALDYEKGLLEPAYSSQVVYNAFQDPGFLFVTNVPEYDPEKLYYWTKWFFDELPESERNLLKTAGKSCRGFVEAREDAASSYKHLLEIGAYDTPKKDEFVLLDENQWPSNPEFRKFMNQYYSLMMEVGSNVLRMVARAMGVAEEEWIRKIQPSNMSTLRLIKYPKRVGETPKDLILDSGKKLFCGTHQDTSVLTLLAIFDQPGLQVLHEGQYKDVETKEAGLVVNIGLMLAGMCGQDSIRPTEHRVLDIGKERYAVPFFMEPRWEEEVDGELNGKMGRFMYGKYVIERLKVFFEHKEYADLLEAQGY